MISIPTIDVSGLPDDQTAINAIAEACEEWGFFQIVGHGIKESLSEEFLSESKRFFRQEIEVKHAVLRSEANPMGFYDRELTKNTPDWKQVFDYGIDFRDPESMSPTRWPTFGSNEDTEAFRAVMVDWFVACEQVSFRLLDALSDAMSVKRVRLRKAFAPVNTSFVRLNFYPRCADPAPSDSGSVIERGSLGVNRHTDAGGLTVLISDEVAALQVNQNDKWYTIEPQQSGLIINAGDMLQVWSNDRFRAAEHRVISYSDCERFSAPFFFNPSFQTTCEPLCGKHEARYHPVNWGHFRTERANGDYADFGEEIQISHFRIE